MKAVILAGGTGSRMGSETTNRPKPLVEIGEHPILWHLMKLYTAYQIRDFIICLGYRGHMIKEYLHQHWLRQADFEIDMVQNRINILHSRPEPWKVTLVETGEYTPTAGRIAQILPLVADDEAFCLTYGDGLADIDLASLVQFHRAHGRLATVTAVQPPGRFGRLDLDGPLVQGVYEKPPGDGNWINGGFFVLSPGVGQYIELQDTMWEEEPMQKLAASGQLMAYRHHGFWQPMDYPADHHRLEQLWLSGNAPWKVWE